MSFSSSVTHAPRCLELSNGSISWTFSSLSLNIPWISSLMSCFVRSLLSIVISDTMISCNYATVLYLSVKLGLFVLFVCCKVFYLDLLFLIEFNNLSDSREK